MKDTHGGSSKHTSRAHQKNKACRVREGSPLPLQLVLVLVLDQPVVVRYDQSRAPSSVVGWCKSCVLRCANRACLGPWQRSRDAVSLESRHRDDNQSKHIRPGQVGFRILGDDSKRCFAARKRFVTRDTMWPAMTDGTTYDLASGAGGKPTRREKDATRSFE